MQSVASGSGHKTKKGTEADEQDEDRKGTRAKGKLQKSKSRQDRSTPEPSASTSSLSATSIASPRQQTAEGEAERPEDNIPRYDDVPVREGYKVNPVEVQIRATLETIIDVDSVSQTFTARVYLECRFPKDFVDKKGRLGENEKMLDHYMQCFKFLNMVEEKTKTDMDIGSSPDGKQWYVRWTTTGVFAENFELDDFPLDTQELTVSIQFSKSTQGSAPVVLKVVADADSLVNSRRCSKVRSLWIIDHYLDLKPILSDPEESSVQKIFPTMDISAVVHRRPMNYFWSIIVPMFLFVQMSVMSFCLAYKDASDRLGVSLTLVLTAAAYKFVVSNMLPAIPYLTLLDKYVMMCSLWLVLIVFENGLVGKFGSASLDFWIFAVLETTFVVANVCFCCKSWRSLKARQAMPPVVRTSMKPESPNMSLLHPQTIGCNV